MSPRWRLPEGPCRLRDARLPAAGGFVRRDLWLADGRVAFDGPDAPSVDLKGAIVFPAFVDCHAHLDKGHIWPRRANPDGRFDSALAAARADRAANWSAGDVRARMTFALRCAFAHGTAAIRTHLDSVGPQTSVTWGVFREVRADWAGRIALQGAALMPIDEAGEVEAVADEVARSGGVLGAVAFPHPALDARLDAIFRAAAARGLDVDFHVDETDDPASRSLRAVAEAKRRNRFGGRVLCGHACSLARQPETEAAATIGLVAECGIDVVSLPLCNLYLQDRAPGRTPRWRGIAPVHELRAAGVRVAFASDNTRDPFHAYGDLDMHEVMREAVRIAHLDHPPAWAAAFAGAPAEAMGIDAGVIRDGGPADLVIFPARDWTELLARPHPDRLVIRGGRGIDARPPDYADLDRALEPA